MWMSAWLEMANDGLNLAIFLDDTQFTLHDVFCLLLLQGNHSIDCIPQQRQPLTHKHFSEYVLPNSQITKN